MGSESFCDEDDDFNWDSEDDREVGLPSSCVGRAGSEAAVCSGLLELGRGLVLVLLLVALLVTFSSPVSKGVETFDQNGTAISTAGSSGTKLIDHFIGMGFTIKAVSDAVREHGEENSDLILEVLLKDSAASSDDSTASAGSDVLDHFVGMGFPKEMVARVIEEHGDSERMDSILETLLSYSEIEKNLEGQPPTNLQHRSPECNEHFLEDFSDLEEDPIKQEFSDFESDEESDSPLVCLMRMGYTEDEAVIAVDRCGPDAPILELADFISAAQQAKADDLFYPEEKPKPDQKKRRLYESEILRKNQRMRLDKNLQDGGYEPLRIPKPMIGFGVPTEPGLGIVTERILPEAAKGPPFFYYENVAMAPKGVWDKISSCLYDVKPEFVDSKYFCAAARKRGYVHNLPIHSRFPLLPLQRLTIHEALPLTKRWWPSWDPRQKLNCILTCVGSARLTERLRKAVEDYEGDPPKQVQEFVLHQCRKWNLVWVGKNKVAPLDAGELEMLLGFPRNHTRGGGASATERYKSLGNSFQVDTVAYHLSPLKDLFPNGMNVLSLFSGIGGGEVALHKLGIRLKNVVSVEISEVNRSIMSCWWEQTNQTGNLIHIPNVQDLDANRLEHFMSRFGGFDLVIGGSPCNNLAGGNRHHRDGLEGKESSLFYDYCRILEVVKEMMSRNR